MTRSGFAREARRRPEMDLLVGPIEAAGANAADPPVELEEPSIGSEESSGLPEEPAWREDG
jgi:hypothetical protein